MEEFTTELGYTVSSVQMTLIRSEVLLATSELLTDEEILRLVDIMKGE